MKETCYVWQVSALQGILTMTCLECSHRGFIAAHALPAGAQRQAIYQLRLMCSRCNGRQVKTVPYVPLP